MGATDNRVPAASGSTLVYNPLATHGFQGAHAMRTSSTLVIAVLTTFILAGCGETSSSAPSDPVDGGSSVDTGQDTGAPSTTYHGDARVILDRRCVSCHTNGGGAPFPMDWNADEWSSGAAWWTSMAMNAIDDGRMPPWQPLDDCRPIEHPRVLDPDELSTLKAWQAEGFPVGDESEYVPPPQVSAAPLPDPTITMTPTDSYVPDATQPDDYRCFLMDATFESDRYATRTDVWPGSKEVVHHVILYRVDGGDISKVEALDESATGLGYPCFGGPGVEGDFIGAWVPGATPFAFPDDSAIGIPAGSRIVMQMHYNTVYLNAEDGVPSDLTTMALWLLPEGERPKDLVYFQPMANTDIFIPANNASSAHVQDRYVGWNALVVGSTPHMHKLGTEIRASLVNENDAVSCLIDIPKWDFNWQQLYTFAEADAPFVHGVSRHRMTCIYDNSPENQPVINGEQSNPKNVTWGDGSFDEMCLNYLLLKFPHKATEHLCGNYDWCAERCDGDVVCALGCAVGSGSACADCVNDGYVACGQAQCPSVTNTALACTGTCTNGGSDVQECIIGDCRAEWQAAHECVYPLMKDPVCAEHFSTCDFGE